MKEMCEHKKDSWTQEPNNFLIPDLKSRTNRINHYLLSFAFLLLTFTLCCSLYTAYAEAAVSIGKVTQIEGRVDILRGGKLPAAPARIGDSVFVKDVIRTKSSSKAEITFNDNTILRIAQRSRIDVSEYIIDGGGVSRAVIDMSRGKVRADVSKAVVAQITKSPKANRFEIRTPNAVAGVRGTDFFVFHSANSTGVLVKKGKVETYNPKFPDVKVEVVEGQITNVTDNKPPTRPKAATDIETKGHEKDVTPEKPKKKAEQPASESDSASESPQIFGYSSPDESTPTDSTGTDGGTIDPPPPPPPPPITETVLKEIITAKDTTAPILTIARSAYPETGDFAAGSFSISSDESATYSYNLDALGWTSTGASLTISGLTEGAHTLDIQATDSAGNASSITTLAFAMSRYSLSGNFWGCIGNVTGSVSGEVAGISGQSWGGWDMTMPGTGNLTPNATWTLYAGGTSSDLTYTDGRNNGYWIEIAPGTSDYSLQTLSGTSTLNYLSYDRLGIGTGIVTGSYVPDPLGYYSNYSLTDTGRGTYTETLLAHAGNLSGDIYNSYGWSGSIFAIMGGTSSLWSGSSITAIGGYQSGGYYPETFLAGSVSSYNYSNGTDTTYDSGAYYGMIGGREVNNAIDAKFYALYVDPAGNAGYLKSGFTGKAYPDISMFDMYSSGIAMTQRVANIGFTADALYGNTYRTSGGGGDFYGDAGNLTGSDNYSFSTMSIYQPDGFGGYIVQPWGIYYNQFTGSYVTDPSSGWTAKMGGGSDPFGGYDCGGWMCDDYGYWLMDVSGTWAGNKMDGTAAGRFITYAKMGTLSGEFIGVYDGSGYWSAMNAGVYEGVPLAWGGEVEYNADGLYNNAAGIQGVGGAYGLVGGTQSPWSGTTALTLMGPYTSYDNAPYLWNSPIYSYNQNDYTYSTFDGGTLWGLTGGIWKEDGTIDAVVYSLYIDPSGNAGILKGSSLTGKYYSDLSMFEADGTWTPAVLATGLDPAPLGSLTYSPDIYFSSYTTADGWLSAGGSIYGGDAMGWKYSMPGENWGIWQTLTAGDYSETTSDTWTFMLENVDSGFIIGTQTQGTKWSSGVLEGKTYGYGADINIPGGTMTWISIGETRGTFDPVAFTWQAVQTGAWLETNKFLAMTADPAGQTQLAKLNIPAVEVGRANLSGSGNNLTVNMNDVIFFAPNNGGAPGIWATGNVNGTYSANPTIGTAVTLTGNGLTTSFTASGMGYSQC